MTAQLFSKRFRTTICSGMLLFALTLRLLLSPAAMQLLLRGLHRAGNSFLLCRAVLLLEGGSVIAQPNASTDHSVPEPTATTAEPTSGVQVHEMFAPQTAAKPVESPLTFSPSEADSIDVRGSCTYVVDKASLLLAPLEWTAKHGKPQVLIIHSHTCEAYTPEAGDGYAASATFRTLDETHNMLAVGDALADALEARGIGVIHDRSCNDYPSYNDSYANSKTAIEQQLAAHPEIVMVLDLHRDALEVPVREATEINGEACAKLMLVVGTDEGGLYHPYWQENLSCALKLQALLNRAQPTLCRQLNLREERFNGHTSPGAMIVEVGSTGNTLAEAKRSMPYLADAVAELLHAQGG